METKIKTGIDKEINTQTDRNSQRQQAEPRRVMDQSREVWVIPLSSLIITKGPSLD